VVVDVTAVLFALVTVSVYLVVVVGVTATAVPLVTVMGEAPPVMTPVPLVKIPVRLAVSPAVMVAGVAEKLVITAAGSTVTETVSEIGDPVVGVTVSL